MPDTQPMQNQVVETELGRTLPSSYQRLGIESGYQMRPIEDLRMFIVGPRFSGKTTFVSGSPRTLILDYEDGAWAVPDKFCRAERLKVKRFDAEEAIFQLLEKDKDNPKRPFDRIVIETIDQMIEVDAEELGRVQTAAPGSWVGDDIRNWGKDGAGYSKLSGHIYDRLRRLESWGYTWTICGHLKEEEVTLGDGSKRLRLRTVCYPSLAAVIARLADVKATVEVTKRVVAKWVDSKDIRTGQTRKVQQGTEEILRIQMDCSAEEGGFSSGAGKLRGVANLRMKLELPDLSSGEIGWDCLAKEYTACATKVKNGELQ